MGRTPEALRNSAPQSWPNMRDCWCLIPQYSPFALLPIERLKLKQGSSRIAGSCGSWYSESYLLRLLRFDVRGVALCEPAFPALDRFGAAVATAVGGIDECAVGEPRPSESAARAAVLQWTIEDRDRIAGLERTAGDTALEQRRRRRPLEAPKCFAAVLVLDIQVEP